MLMRFSPMTIVDSWVKFLPGNTLSLLLENDFGKENLLFLLNAIGLSNLRIIFTLLIIY